VVAVARPVLGHRLLLDVDRLLRGATVERVLTEVLGSVPVPVPASER
jgi:MoxR-like ATPase